MIHYWPKRNLTNFNRLLVVVALLLSIASCNSEDPVPRRVVHQEAPAAPPTHFSTESGAQFSLAGGTLDDRIVARELSLEHSAVNALASIGAAAVPALLEMLADPDPALRSDAARAIARIGSDARDAVPQLTAALGDPDVNVRRYAARALGSIGPSAEEAVPALIDVLRQDVKQVEAAGRKAAAENVAAEQAASAHTSGPFGNPASAEGRTPQAEVKPTK